MARKTHMRRPFVHPLAQSALPLWQACSARPALILILSLIVLAFTFPVPVSGGTCLGDAVPAEERKYISFSEDVQLPLGIYRQGWETAMLVAQVASIVVQETLGYHTTFSGTSSSSLTAAMDITGCSMSSSASLSCPDGPVALDNPHHASLEIWWAELNGFGKEAYDSVNELRTPYYYSIGYMGTEGMYVNKAVVEAGEVGNGWRLDFYGDYNAEWKEPWKYFDDYTNLSSDLLTPCSDTEASDVAKTALVQQFTPDPSGFYSNGTAVCQDGVWWLSPACRDRPSTCLPFLTGSVGLQIMETMQRAIEYKMPVAIGTLKSYSLLLSLPQTYRSLYWTWEPSMHSLTYDPQRVMFPWTDTAAAKEGDARTQTATYYLETLVSQGLADVAPRVHSTLGAITFTSRDIKNLMMQYFNNPDYDAVACWWLQNTTSWRDWIPTETACTAGEGLVDGSGNFVVNRSSATSCSACSAGHYSVKHYDREGITHICYACPAGESQPMWGSEECVQCEAGYFMGMEGQSSCNRCPEGTFTATSGSTECTGCPVGMTTYGTGFRSFDHCVCPEDTYESPEGGSCISCGEGANCEGFGAEPEAAEGYLLAEVLSSGLWIYRCSTLPERCPGGPVGTCNTGRTGIACSKCLEGMAPSGATCEPCGASDMVPSVVLLSVCATLLVVLYVHSSQEQKARQSASSLLIVVVVAQMVAVLQTVGVVARISVDWPEPMAGLQRIVRAVTFDMDELVRFSCVAPLSPIANYTMKLTIIPVVSLFLTILHCLASCYYKDFHRRHFALISAVGVVVMAFYVSISGLILSPFQCLSHPNGVWTLMQYQTVVCWDSGDHVVMLVISCLATSIPVGFLATVFHLLRVFPTRMARGDVHFLSTFAFLFVRVKPRWRWFVFFGLCRNLFIALVPSIPDSFWQTFILETTFLFYFGVVVRILPWKLDVANALDIGSTAAILFVIVISAAFLPSDDRDRLPQAALVLVLTMFSLFPLILGVTLGRRFWYQHRKRFRWFLCHQKAASGAFARVLKLSLAPEASGSGTSVFLDSDDLSDLAKLFGYVRDDVQTLLVLASREVFHSSWCLAEVTTASLYKVETKAILFPDFIPPDDEFFSKLDQNVPLEQLAEHGFGAPELIKALKQFNTLEKIRLAEEFDEAQLSIVTSQIVGKSTRSPLNQRGSSMSISSRGSCSAQNIILADEQSLEAVASAMILVKLVTPLLSSDPMKIPIILGPGSNRNSKCRNLTTVGVFLPFFTTGCFSCRDYLLHLLHMSLAEILHIQPIVSSESFSFPTPSFYIGLEELVANMGTSLGIVLAGDSLTPFVRRIFSKICSRLSVQGSMEVLQVQAAMVVRTIFGADVNRANKQDVSQDTDTLRNILDRASESDGQCRRSFVESEARTGSGTLSEISGSGTLTPHKKRLSAQITSQPNVVIFDSLEDSAEPSPGISTPRSDDSSSSTYAEGEDRAKIREI